MDADTRRWLEKQEKKLDQVGQAVARMEGVLSNGIVRGTECRITHAASKEDILHLRSRVNWLYGLVASFFVAAMGAIIALAKR